jgi:hypothetical protein
MDCGLIFLCRAKYNDVMGFGLAWFGMAHLPKLPRTVRTGLFPSDSFVALKKINMKLCLYLTERTTEKYFQ